MIGIMRDVRGVAHALSAKIHYALLIDWLYPDFFTMMLRGMEVEVI